VFVKHLKKYSERSARTPAAMCVVVCEIIENFLSFLARHSRGC